MSAALFRAQIAPAAILDNFDFDAKFTIISFSFTLIPKGKDLIGPYQVANRAGCRLKGAGENANISKAMDMAKIGDKVVIEDIKAVGPDGQVRSLNTIFLTLN